MAMIFKIGFYRSLKNNLLVLLGFLIAINCFSQSENDEIFFDRGFNLYHYPNNYNYDKTKTDSAEFYMLYFINNADTNDPNYSLRLFLFSDFYKEEEDFEKEEQFLIRFLKFKLPEKYSSDLEVDLEPANYFYRASLRLAELNIQNGDFESALQYMMDIENTLLSHFCGNYYFTVGLKKAELLSDIYVGLNQPDTAIKIMLPHIFNQFYYDLGSYNYKLVGLLNETYGLPQVKTMTEVSFNGLYNRVDTLNDSTIYSGNYINFLDVEIHVPVSLGNERFLPHYVPEYNIENYRRTLFESNFYRQIFQ